VRQNVILNITHHRALVHAEVIRDLALCTIFHTRRSTLPRLNRRPVNSLVCPSRSAPPCGPKPSSAPTASPPRQPYATPTSSASSDPHPTSLRRTRTSSRARTGYSPQAPASRPPARHRIAGTSHRTAVRAAQSAYRATDRQRATGEPARSMWWPVGPLLRAAAWFCGPSVPVGSVVVCGGADCPLFHRPPYRGTGDGGDSRLDRSCGDGRGRLGTVGTVV